MSWLDSTVTGLAEVRFGCGMRVPVMTMSPALRTVSPVAEVDGVVVPSTGAVVSGAEPVAVSAGLHPAVPAGVPGGHSGAGDGFCANAGEAAMPAPTRRV